MSELRFLRELEMEFERVSAWDRGRQRRRLDARLPRLENVLAFAVIALVVAVVAGVGAVFLATGRDHTGGGSDRVFPAGPALDAVPSGFGVGSVTAVDARRWWVLGYSHRMCAERRCATIVRTTDGGRSFVAIPAPNVPYQYEPAGYTPGVQSIYFADPRDGYLYFNSLFVTHNGGATWREPRTPLIRTLDVTSGGGEAYVLGQAGPTGGTRVFRSPVGEDRWTPVAGTAGAETISARESDLFVTLALRSGDYILVSHDRGGTFAARYRAPAQSSCTIQPAAGTVLWALCDGPSIPTLYHSTDDGRTLTSLDVGLPLHNGAVFAAASSGTALVGFKQMYRTTDGGGRFSLVQPPHIPTNDTLQWVYLSFTDTTHGLAMLTLIPRHASSFAVRNYLYQTTDGGQSYHPVHISRSTATRTVRHRLGTCRTSQLRIKTIRSAAAGGTAWSYIGFTNKGRTGCELSGWPSLVATTTSGKIATARDVPASAFPATTATIPPRIIKLSPGRRADAAYSAADGAATKCPPSYRWLRITPPGNTNSILLSAWNQDLGRYLPDCSAIAISPVVPPAYLQRG